MPVSHLARSTSTWKLVFTCDLTFPVGLALLLRSLHALPAVGRAFKPLKAAGRYARQIGTVDAGKLFERAALAHTLIEPYTPVLCHNDLFCENIIECDGLTLIDWEYAGPGDPFFDLAIVVQHHGLKAGPAGHLLWAYLQHEPRRADHERLAKQCRFYQALLDLWNLRVGATYVAPTFRSVCATKRRGRWWTGP